MKALAIALAAAAALAGCGEKPPRPDPEAVPAYNVEHGTSPLAGRTLYQGESARMSY